MLGQSVNLKFEFCNIQIKELLYSSKTQKLIKYRIKNDCMQIPKYKINKAK